MNRIHMDWIGALDILLITVDYPSLVSGATGSFTDFICLIKVCKFCVLSFVDRIVFFSRLSFFLFFLFFLPFKGQLFAGVFLTPLFGLFFSSFVSYRVKLFLRVLLVVWPFLVLLTFWF